MKSAQVLAGIALLGAAHADAADGSVTIGASWGEVADPTDRYDWEGGNTNRLLVGYDPGDVPIFFELARLESDASSNRERCPAGFACGGIVADLREFSAWQLAAGYRFWAHRNTGSAISLRAGLYDAESTVEGERFERFRNSGYFLGIVGTLMLNPVIGMRVEWEYLDGLEDIERYDTSQTMAGVVMKFGGYAPFNP